MNLKCEETELSQVFLCHNLYFASFWPPCGFDFHHKVTLWVIVKSKDFVLYANETELRLYVLHDHLTDIFGWIVTLNEARLQNVWFI